MELAQEEEHEVPDELDAGEEGPGAEGARDETTSIVVEARMKIPPVEEELSSELRGRQMLRLVVGDAARLELRALLRSDCKEAEVRLMRLELGERRRTSAVTRVAWSHGT